METLRRDWFAPIDRGEEGRLWKAWLFKRLTAVKYPHLLLHRWKRPQIVQGSNRMTRDI